jgi:predicted enzyme related to lactoylglutathione lyase
MRLNQVTVPALDVQASVAFYVSLGLRLIVSAPHYARFECPEGDSTFSVHLTEKAPPGPGVVVYFECADLDATVSRLKAAGHVVAQEPTDQPWLWREARLYDPARNEICLYCAGENRRFPPWRLQSSVPSGE